MDLVPWRPVSESVVRGSPGEEPRRNEWQRWIFLPGSSGAKGSAPHRPLLLRRLELRSSAPVPSIPQAMMWGGGWQSSVGSARPTPG